MTQYIGRFACILVLLAWASPTTAESRSINYLDVAGWDVDAIYDETSNRFSFCTAATIYRDRTYFMINVDYSGQWSLSLFNKNWPVSRTGTLPVTLIVDERVVDRSEATWLQSGALVRFGTAVEKVVALMRGRTLAIATPEGTSRFSLDGSYKAALAAFECWRLHSAAGAPQESSGGAFGGGQVSTSNTAPKRYNRAQTLEVAMAYLGGIGVPYEVLPERQNFFSNLPVNWKYGTNSVGGMLILSGAGLSGEATLVSLLEDQARLCTGKSGTSRTPPQTGKDATYYYAKGACEMEGSTFSALYSVTEGSDFVVVIVELLDATDVRANPELDQKSAPSGELLSRFDLN